MPSETVDTKDKELGKVCFKPLDTYMPSETRDWA